MTEKLLTVDQVAEYLNMSRDEVKKLVEIGELPAYKIGGAFLRFKKEHIEIYKRKHVSGTLAGETLFKDRGIANYFPEVEKELSTGETAFRHRRSAKSYTFWEKLEDFLYYNDFYILSVILLVLTILAVFEF